MRDIWEYSYVSMHTYVTDGNIDGTMVRWVMCSPMMLMMMLLIIMMIFSHQLIFLKSCRWPQNGSQEKILGMEEHNNINNALQIVQGNARY